MSDDIDKTKAKSPEFDFSAFPGDSVFHERRDGADRRNRPKVPVNAPGVEKKMVERREKKERRKRIDPTTFEKQYTEEELEFMTAMQRFKERSGKPFPTYREVLKVAVSLGYRRLLIDEGFPGGLLPNSEPLGINDPRPDAEAPPLAPHVSSQLN